MDGFPSETKNIELDTDSEADGSTKEVFFGTIKVLDIAIKAYAMIAYCSFSAGNRRIRLVDSSVSSLTTR